MRVRFPGFGFVLSAACAVSSSACAGRALVAGSAKSEATALPAPGFPGATPESAADDATTPSGEGGLAIAPQAPSPLPSHAGSTDGPAREGESRLVAPRREMLDIEATVTLRVAKLKTALASLRQLAARAGGVVTSERVDSATQHGSAQLTLRVPSASTQSVLHSLDVLGTITHQSVSARDIGKDYFDANVRLSNLEATLRRYQEILTQATKVEEVLRIEQELGRLRTEIEQVKGNLRWLSDRAARSTLHVNLSEERPEIAYSEEPEPKFFPGLRVAGLIDFDEVGTRAYAGAGLSIRGSRRFSLDLDLLERGSSAGRGPDALIATLGGELYSDLLGDGRRRFLNPYLGWRAGYAHFDDDHQALIGVTLGVELVKTSYFMLDAEARNYLVGGGDRGFHYGLTPALAASVAF